MRIRDWSSDVCSSDLLAERACGAVFVVVDKRVELVVSQQAGLFAAVLFEQLLTRQAVFLGARVKHLLRGLTDIGRTSCRERVGQYVSIPVGASYLKKKTRHITHRTQHNKTHKK